MKEKTDLYRKEFTDEWQKHHVFTVPHLLSIDLYSASELPPLPTVLHKDLFTHTHNTSIQQYFYLHNVVMKSKCQEKNFTIRTQTVKNCLDYNYLGLLMTLTRSFNVSVN